MLQTNISSLILRGTVFFLASYLQQGALSGQTANPTAPPGVQLNLISPGNGREADTPTIEFKITNQKGELNIRWDTPPPSTEPTATTKEKVFVNQPASPTPSSPKPQDQTLVKNPAALTLSQVLPLAQVFTQLAKEAHINYVDPGIPPEQTIAFTLQNTNPYNAFIEIAHARGYTILQKDGVVTLYKAGLEGAPPDPNKPTLVTHSYPIKTTSKLAAIAAHISPKLSSPDHIRVLRSDSSILITGTQDEQDLAQQLIAQEDYTDDTVQLDYISYAIALSRAQKILGRPLQSGQPSFDVLDTNQLNDLESKLINQKTNQTGNTVLTPQQSEAVTPASDLEKKGQSVLSVQAQMDELRNIRVTVNANYHNESPNNRVSKTAQFNSSLQPGQAILYYGLIEKGDPHTLTLPAVKVKVRQDPDQAIVSILKFTPVLQAQDAPQQQQSQDQNPQIKKKTQLTREALAKATR